MKRDYCVYLRKSRADAEAERRGEGETLARHESALLLLAEKQGLAVTRVYREVASGETISARPEMQKLLDEVERGFWAGVLVMEVERLARGDTVDQGLVAQAFRLSGTRIITPLKTYDPADEFDEEYFEFGLFMSRREYKAINRRLQRGRLASVNEGKYVANKAPYGYLRVKLPDDKGFTLEPDAERAEIIRLIYDMLLNGAAAADGERRGAGAYLIARRLNELRIPSATGNGWTQASVRDILINPVYAGKIRWGWRKTVKVAAEGGYIIKRPRLPPQDCQITEGLHEAIIPEGDWNRAQEIMLSRAVACVPSNRSAQNPLSGLLICGKCGRRMSRRPDSRGKSPASIICASASCDNVSSYLHHVENAALECLSDWLEGYMIELSEEDNGAKARLAVRERAVLALEQELETAGVQINNLHDLLERGVYDDETYLARFGALKKRRTELSALLENARNALQAEKKYAEPLGSGFPGSIDFKTAYGELASPAARNRLLKEVMEKAVYTKECGGRWNGRPDGFTLVLYPRLPKLPQLATR